MEHPWRSFREHTVRPFRGSLVRHSPAKSSKLLKSGHRCERSNHPAGPDDKYAAGKAGASLLDEPAIQATRVSRSDVWSEGLCPSVQALTNSIRER